jgi:hypothetical protein
VTIAASDWLEAYKYVKVASDWLNLESIPIVTRRKFLARNAL